MSEIKAKKASILTIEKELLSSYMEALSDMKQVLAEKEDGFPEESHRLLKLYINKHVNKLKSSGIWDV